MSRMAETMNRLMVARKTKAICHVYETEDYTIFKEMEHNRDVAMSRVKKLLASFSEKEILNPIVVNEKMEIIDGQGRYEALKLLKRPIKFVVADNATIDDCRRMNAYNTNWSTIDFVKSYAGSNNQNYLLLLGCQKQTGLPFSKILRFAGINEFVHHGNTRSPSHYKNSVINSGKLIFTEDHFKKVVLANEMAKEILSALDITSKQGLDIFYKCISVIFGFEGYNHERMVKKCKLCRSSFCLMGSMEDMLTEFSRVYNYKASSKDKLYFQDYMRDKGYNKMSYEGKTMGGYDSEISGKTLH